MIVRVELRDLCFSVDVDINCVLSDLCFSVDVDIKRILGVRTGGISSYRRYQELSNTSTLDLTPAKRRGQKAGLEEREAQR